MLQASSHQGALKFDGKGKQCMAIAVTAIINSHDIKPKNWREEAFDKVLEFGDTLYTRIIKDTKSNYLGLDDIPNCIAGVKTHLSNPLCGLINDNEPNDSLYSLEGAICNLTDSEKFVGCLITIGKSVPSYTTAIVKNESQFYFIDSHSRDKMGMPSSDGLATMTVYNTTNELILFIRKLSKAIFQNLNGIQFELAKLSILDLNHSESDCSSDFSGFDPVSEGEYSCLLALGDENLGKISTPDVSEISSISRSSSLNSISLDEAITGLDDSSRFLEQIDIETFTSIPLESSKSSESLHVGNSLYKSDESEDLEDFDDSNDEDYWPDDGGDDDDDDDDDDKPLAFFAKRMRLSKPDNKNINGKLRENERQSNGEINNACTEGHVTISTENTNERTSKEIIEDADDHCLLGSTSANISSHQVGRGTCRSKTRQVKTGRKRVRTPSLWKRKVSKSKKNLGIEYYSIYSKKIKSARKMKSGCGSKCRYKCHSKFNEGERENIFHKYWGLGDINKQRQFLENYAVKKPKSLRKCNSSNTRKNSIYWSFPNTNGGNEKSIQVCKTFFLATLNISDQMVATAHKKVNAIGLCENDQRGCHKVRLNKTPDFQKEQVRNHIRSFKTVESHYCRKDSQKLYLPADLNVKKMHRLYINACEQSGSSPVSLTVYRNIFDLEFNISFHKPIKDRCDFCVKFQNATDLEKESLRVQYERHINNKTLSREGKEYLKNLTKSGSKPQLVAACFDLEQVLVTPKSFESSLYYKRRLNTYNFTVYDLGSGKADCFVWNETIASRGSNEIASCVYSFIKSKAESGKRQFVFFSDNCCGQNKNKNYLSMLWFCLHKFSLTSIEHRYLEKGHTQNENDSVHAAIETASKNVSIYTTSQWAATMRIASHKNPYNVHELHTSDFFDFKNIASYLKNFTINEENDKVYWNDIKTLSMKSTNMRVFNYQLDHNGTIYTVDLFHRKRSKVNMNDIQLLKLFTDNIPIPRAKYFDLLQLCRSGVIPSVHHPFFLFLLCEQE